MALETDRPVTIPTARGQTWQGRDSCSALTQLVRSWESLAYLQLCSGSPAGRWRVPCSYRLAARWRRSCLRWTPQCAGSWFVFDSGDAVAPWKGPNRRRTHPARVAVVAQVATSLISIWKMSQQGGPLESTCHPSLNQSVDLAWRQKNWFHGQNKPCLKYCMRSREAII